MARSELFNRVQPGGVYTIANLSDHPGSVFFVDSTQTTTGADAAGYGYNPDAPFLTLDYALSSDVCTASKGDTIYVMPGHTEAVVSAGDITADIAGVRIVGLGEGNLRPTFSFTTAATASFLVSAANVSIENCIFDCTGVDSVNGPLNITGAGCAVRDCEFEMADSAGQADCAILTEATANDLIVENCYFFGSSDAGTVVAIDLVGGDSIKIRNNVINAYFTNNVGGIRNATTAGTNYQILNNVVVNNTGGSTKAIIMDAGTTGVVDRNYMVVLSGTTPLTAAAMYWGDNVCSNAVGVSPVRVGEANKVEDMLAGTAGIASWANGAAPANGVSISEGLRDVWDVLRNGTGGSEPTTNKSIIDCLGVTLAAFDAAAEASNSVSLGAVLRYMHVNQLSQIDTKSQASCASGSLFTYTGNIRIDALYAVITTAIQDQATTVQLYVKPDSLANYNITGNSGSIQNMAIGTLVSITGTAANDIAVTTAVGSLAPFQAGKVIATCVTSGVIGVTYGAASTGALTWYLVWTPLSAGATVAPA